MNKITTFTFFCAAMILACASLVPAVTFGMPDSVLLPWPLWCFAGLAFVSLLTLASMLLVDGIRELRK